MQQSDSENAPVRLTDGAAPWDPSATDLGRALHEAGHAITYAVLGARVTEVTIEVSDDGLGHTIADFDPNSDQKLVVDESFPQLLSPISRLHSNAIKEWIGVMAGGVAEAYGLSTADRRLSEYELLSETEDDERRLNELTESLSKASLSSYEALRYEETWGFVLRLQREINALATALLHQTVLHEIELEALLRRLAQDGSAWQREVVLTDSERRRGADAATVLGLAKWPADSPGYRRWWRARQEALIADARARYPYF